MIISTLVVVGAILTVVFAPLYEEVRRFADDIPGYIDDLRRSRLLRELDARYDILEKLQEQATTLPERLPGTAGAFLGFAGAIFNAIFKALTVLFLTVFLLLELPAIGRSILSLLAPPTAERTRALTDGRQRHGRPLRRRGAGDRHPRRHHDARLGDACSACRSRS